VNVIVQPIWRWMTEVGDFWNRFWFTPSQPHTLALIRILAGSMLFYTHLVYTLDLMAFLGPNSWITVEVSRQLYESMGVNSAWSYLWYVQSPALLWILHILALVVFAMFTLGLYSRTTSVLAWLITLSYCHRLSRTRSAPFRHRE